MKSLLTNTKKIHQEKNLIAFASFFVQNVPKTSQQWRIETESIDPEIKLLNNKNIISTYYLC
jgi:hypothetical protein